MAAAFVSLNWLPVIAAGLAYFMLGALWFAPFGLGNQYYEGLGFVRPEGWKPGAIYYVGPLAGCLVISLASASLIGGLGLVSFGDAILFGLVAGLGIAAAVTGINAITPMTPKPMLFAAVVGSYHVAGIVLVSVILTLWR